MPVLLPAEFVGYDSVVCYTVSDSMKDITAVSFELVARTTRSRVMSRWHGEMLNDHIFSAEKSPSVFSVTR